MDKSSLLDKFRLKDKGCHFRLDAFVKNSKNKYESTNKTNVLAFDYDLIDKYRIGEAFTSEQTQAEVLNIFTSLLKFFAIKKDNIFMVSTGYGFHVYIFFDKEYSPVNETWIKPMLREYSSMFTSVFLKVDTQTASPSKTMRVPGSYYNKDGRHPHMTETGTNKPVQISFDIFKEKFKRSFIKPINKNNFGLKTIHKRRHIDVSAILGGGEGGWTGCRFLRWSYENQEDPNYEEYMAQLRLTSRFNKDREKSYHCSREFSRNNKGFDEKEFNKKFHEALDKMYPSTCKHIESIWRFSKDKKFGCVTCPHKKLNLPLLISKYPDKDTGFREIKVTKTGERIKLGINYTSFCRYLNEQKKILCERDDTVYKYNKQNFYERSSMKLVVSEHMNLVQPQIKPNEIKQLGTFFKNSAVMNREEEERQNQEYIFFKNGNLNLRTMVLENMENSTFKNFYRSPVDYDGDAQCPLYSSLIDFAFGDDIASRDYFFLFIARALFLKESFHKAMVLYGRGSNGKSSLMNGISDLFPEESDVFFPLDFRCLGNDDSYKGRLRSARLSYCSDADRDFMGRGVSLIKRLIGQESFSYRNKYSPEVVNFKNTSKLIFGLNELPDIKENSFGLQRRFSILEFKNTIPEKSMDLALGDKLKKERAGIFNLLIEYLERYKTKELLMPLLSSSIYREAEEQSFAHVSFLKNRIIVNKDAKITRKDLFDAFQNYCIEQNEKTFLTFRQFIFKTWPYLRGLGVIKIQQNGARYLLGISIAGEDHDPT